MSKIGRNQCDQNIPKVKKLDLIVHSFSKIFDFFFTQTQYTHLQKSQTRGIVCGDDKMTMTKAPITWHEYLCHNSSVLLPTQHKLVRFHKFLSKIRNQRIWGYISGKNCKGKRQLGRWSIRTNFCAKECHIEIKNFY